MLTHASALGCARYTAGMPQATRRGRGPFQPGLGGLPPYLAGRESEQTTFREFVEELRQRKAVGTAVVLYGPRGNGKTALLRWMVHEIAEGNERTDEGEAGIETLWLTPPQIGTVTDLVEEVAQPSARERFQVERVGVPGVVDVRVAAEGGAVRTLGRTLSGRVGQKPLVLLLDEAHNLDAEVGYALLNASQVVSGEAPFLLVLAGTPDLEDRLDGMRVSFWDRAERMRLGRLSEEAAGEAIRRPLVRDGIGVADDLLTGAYRDNHGYPFFVQHWGRELWRRAKSRAQVTAEDVSEAREAVEVVRQGYYGKRYREMQRAGLLRVAREVAEAFRAEPEPGQEDGFHARPRLADHELRAAVRRGLGAEYTRERASGAELRLRHLGYIWPTGFEAMWEPGIPSLMAYMWNVVPSTIQD